MLEKNGRWIRQAEDKKDFELLTVATASSALKNTFKSEYKRFEKLDDPEVHFIVHFIKRRTRFVDNSKKSLTFNELKSVLNSKGFDIDGPKGGKIGLWKQHRSGWWLWEKKEQYRITMIKFPGWTRQVPKSTLKLVRLKTGLTNENGFDMENFYNGTEPMYSLISEFERPLRRLRDK